MSRVICIAVFVLAIVYIADAFSASRAVSAAASTSRLLAGIVYFFNDDYFFSLVSN